MLPLGQRAVATAKWSLAALVGGCRQGRLWKICGCSRVQQGQLRPATKITPTQTHTHMLNIHAHNVQLCAYSDACIHTHMRVHVGIYTLHMYSHMHTCTCTRVCIWELGRS